jgi:hypothetical protein
VDADRQAIAGLGDLVEDGVDPVCRPMHASDACSSTPLTP